MDSSHRQRAVTWGEAKPCEKTQKRRHWDAGGGSAARVGKAVLSAHTAPVGLWDGIRVLRAEHRTFATRDRHGHPQ